MKILRKEASAGDAGTYWSNANIAGCQKAKRDVKVSYNEIKEFMTSHVDAYIVSATLEHLNMATREDDIIPAEIKGAPLCVQRRWLHDRVMEMVDKYAMSQVQASFENVAAELQKLSSKRHICQECGMVSMAKQICVNGDNFAPHIFQTLGLPLPLCKLNSHN